MRVDGVEVELARDREDEGFEGGEPTEAAGASFSCLKQAIESSEEAGGLAAPGLSDDALRVSARERGDLFHGLELAAHHTGAPALDHGAHDVDLLAVEDFGQLLLLEPGARRTHGARLGDQGVEFCRGLGPRARRSRRSARTPPSHDAPTRRRCAPALQTASAAPAPGPGASDSSAKPARGAAKSGSTRRTDPLGSLRPRRTHMPAALVLVKVQVPVTLGDGVVHRVYAFVPSDREAAAGGKADRHRQQFRCLVELQRLHRPRRTDAQCRFKPLGAHCSPSIRSSG